MLKLTFLTIAASFALPLQSADRASPTIVTLPTEWAAGTKYSLELVVGREDGSGKRERASTPIDVEIVEQREDGYLCRWTYGKTTMLEGAGKGNPVVERMSSLNEGYAMDMLLNEHGRVVGLHDIEGSKRRFDVVIQEVKSALAADGTPMQQLDAVFEQIFSMLKGPTFEAVMTKNPTLVYGYCGSELELGETVEFETELPNPLGGAPFPAKGSYRLAAIRADQHEVELQAQQTVDAKQAAESMRASMVQLAEKLGKPGPTPADIPSVVLEDSGTWVFDSRTGLPRSVEWKRVSEIGDKKRVDLLGVKVKMPETK